MQKKISLIYDELIQNGGYFTEGFNARYEEYVVTFVLPKDVQAISGYGKDPDEAFIDAARSFDCRMGTKV